MDFVFYVETHQTPERRLPIINGNTLISVHKMETHTDNRVSGLGDVAILVHSHVNPYVDRQKNVR